MNKQPSSRRFLLGLQFFVSIFLASSLSIAANAQAMGDQFSSCGNEFGTGDCSSSGDTFSSSGGIFTSGKNISGPNFFYKDLPEQNAAFEENEKIDPSLFTWTDDPRDAFGAPLTDSLQKYPLYKGSMRGFSFVKVSDAQQIQQSWRKDFEPPRKSKPPKWDYVYIGGPSVEGPISDDYYTDSFGHTTALYGWPVNRQPVRIYFAGDVADARNGLTKRVFIECMRQWCLATMGHLKFTVIEDSRSADIILCRDLTTNHELAENNPAFSNGWLDRVKIKLLDSTLDKIDEAQLRAVLLHSAGHAIGYFKHTPDKNSAMSEVCSYVYNPTQKLCPCDAAYIRQMYASYKLAHEGRFKEPPATLIRVPHGKPFLGSPLTAGGTGRPLSLCPYKAPRPMVAAVQRLSLNQATVKSLNAPKPVRAPKSASTLRTVARALPHASGNQSGRTLPRLSFKP